MFRKRKPLKQDILHALSAIADPLSGRSLVDSGWVGDIVVENGHVLVTLEIDPSRGTELEALRQEAEKVIKNLKGAKTVQVILTSQTEAPSTAQDSRQRPFIPYVKNVIAVASGKGGVGKSTVAVNLAVALARQGLKVGLLDADIYGPSVPILMGLRGQKPQQEKDYLIPLEAHGVKVMSMGFLTNEETPMIWRGPMVQSAIQQLLRDVSWEDLDVLFLDMPPGTGDAQLTVAQRVPLMGALIVSTPQDVALLDAVKAVEMFRKVSVPILGLVENMSVFHCPHCGHDTPIFNTEGAKKRAQDLEVPFLGAVPLDRAICTASDTGTPIVLQQDQPASRVFNEIADMLKPALERAVPSKYSNKRS